MTKIDLYKTSLLNFIKQETSLFSNSLGQDIYDLLIAIDMTYAILSLTLSVDKFKTKSTNKNKSYQTYNLGACVLFLILFKSLMEKKESNISLITIVISIVYETINKHIKILEEYHSNFNVYDEIIKIISNTLASISTLNHFTIKISDDKYSSDLGKYLHNIDLTNLKVVQNFDQFIELKYFNISYVVWTICWLSTINNSNNIDKMINISKSFASLYLLSCEFDHLKTDIENQNNLNYIIANGIENSYKLYLTNKSL